MNRIHRKVWSARLGAFVAVAETARSRGKSAGVCGAVLASVLLSAPALAQVAAGALPTGGQVTAGQAGIRSAGATMTIDQGSQRAAINWQSFNVGSGASVQFNQPNASAITLNRVVGNEGSVINGALRANGQVWLVNPNGVLFGAGARVDVGSLVASTRGISDADFMAGRATFQGTGTGDVRNLGQINAADGGYVALIGRAVRNDGTVTARLGTMAGAAGDKVTLNFGGDSLVGVAIEQGTLDALVANGGAVRADGGRIVLAAKTASELVDAAVNNTGELRARTIADHGGRILLLSDMEHGVTSVGGRIDAGAPEGGNGGFVETSAARVRVADGASITTAAAKGRSGTWLIDPTDFTIAASGGDITGAQLAAQLAGGNVTIQTSAGGSGSGDILVQDNIAKAAGGDATLTLQAHHSVTVDTNVSIASTSGKLNLVASANNDGSNTGEIRFAQGSSVDTHGGNVVLGGALAGGVPANDHSVDIAFEPNVSLSAGTGAISLYGRDVNVNEYVTLSGNTISADTRHFNMYWVDGVRIAAADALDIRATDGISASGTYQPAAGSAVITSASQSVLKAGRSMTLASGQNLDLYGLSLQMTGTGTDTMVLSAGGNLSIEDISATYAGTPDLTIKARQAATQSSVSGIDANYGTIAGYLAGTGRTLYQLLEDSGSDVAGAHFGLGGAAYKLQVYSDGALTTVAPKSFDNGNLAIGNGLTDSVNAMGNLRQPFYRDPVLNQWFKLTYWNYDMDLGVGLGGAGTAGWNNGGSIIASNGGTDSLQSSISNLAVSTVGLSRGVGTILVGYDLTDASSGSTVHMSHEYSLGTGDQFIKAVTRTVNTSASAIDNVRLWVGTRDDYVAITDTNVKTKGNITSSGFQPISSQSDQARSIVISEFDPSTNGAPGSAVLFHSTNVDADTVTDWCCSFGNIINKDPRTSDVVTPNQDGSYGIFMNYGSMGAGATRQVTWYYGAAPLASIGNVVTQVINAGGTQIALPTAVTPPATATPAPAPAPAPAPVAAATPAPAPVPQQVSEQALAPARTLLVPVIQVPLALPPAASAGGSAVQVVNAPASVQAVFGGADNLLVSPAVDANQSSVPVNLGEARQMLRGGGSQGDQVRVPASRNSLVQIVDGGVTLPGGVEQLLFVTSDR
ncbi:two-partner secretion domain-containing protein [Ramlibacter humi]|uniref:Filamentous hemagglutinin N-terminal domain-containing protein n=1 Tax=Ramlibacter humi TaxID=2530451 RepID=A0A4Z0BQ08_9BURK|nr:filamentous hemagglutinin N-terminal domain-containing protein [Ramlibacter humi]TFZ00135.1 filamentous hemagglutinin N-terminal domain-containing protein [Ramlibacter humi]